MRGTLFGVGSLLLLAGCTPASETRLAAVLPLTGESAIYGGAVDQGVQLAYEELERSGALPAGLTLDVVDTGSDPEAAARLLREQYGGGAFAAIGGVTSPEALAMIAQANEAGRVLLSPSAGSPELTGASRYFYRIFPTSTRESTTMGTFATGKLGRGKAVVLTAAGQTGDAFVAEFERTGGEVAEVLDLAGAGDAATAAETALAHEPDTIYLAVDADNATQMVQALREAAFEGSILTTSAFASREVIRSAGDAAEGVAMTLAGFGNDSEDEAVRAFVAAYREKYGEEPDLYAAHGYDALKVLVAALEGEGAGAADFWKVLRSIEGFSGITGTIQFDERGDVQKFPRVYRVADGGLIDYERLIRDRQEELRRRREELRKKLDAIRSEASGSDRAGG